MAARSQTGNITDKVEEQGARECEREKKAAIRHYLEAIVPQHCQELPFDQFQEEYAVFGGQESLERHVLGPAQRRLQGLDVCLDCVESGEQAKVEAVQGWNMQ